MSLFTVCKLHSFTSCLRNLQVFPAHVEIQKGLVHVMFTSYELARKGAVIILHSAEYAQPVLVDEIPLSFVSICGYAMKNMCRIKVASKTGTTEYSTPEIINDLTKHLPKSSFSVTCTPDADELVLMMKTEKEKEIISNLIRSRRLFLAGLHWVSVKNTSRKKRKPRKYPSLPPELAYKRYLDFARTQTIRLVAQVEKAVHCTGVSDVPAGLDGLERLLEKVNHELTERVYAPLSEITDDSVNAATREGIMTVLSRSKLLLEYEIANRTHGFQKRKAEMRVRSLHEKATSISDVVMKHLQAFSQNMDNLDAESFKESLKSLSAEIHCGQEELCNVSNNLKWEPVLLGYRKSIRSLFSTSTSSIVLLLQLLDDTKSI